MTPEKPRPTCFVISPIGREGTEQYQTFRDVLDYIIKPAVKESGVNLDVVRADDIRRAGSFIKDILAYISNSDVVIADLTTQNANVFYELGVRHALSARTILVAQNLEDIPSDLREYRTIVYDMSAKGAAQFRERLAAFLNEIQNEPGRPDNPVLDRLGSVFESRTQELQQEITSLRTQLETVLKKGPVKAPAGPASQSQEPVDKRLGRIVRLNDGRRILVRETFTLELENETRRFTLPPGEGSFELYYLQSGEDRYRLWYIASADRRPPLDSYIADMRVLLEHSAKAPGVHVEFIVAAPQSTPEDVQFLKRAFAKLLTFVPKSLRALYSLQIWDEADLSSVERELGIKVDLDKDGAAAPGRKATKKRR